MNPNCILNLLDITDNALSYRKDLIEESEDQIEKNTEQWG